jgi:hypothetical protein
MYAYKSRVIVPPSHEVVLRLPPDVPEGEAEVIVLTTDQPAATPTAVQNFDDWLDELLEEVPSTASVPLEALRRENLYED